MARRRRAAPAGARARWTGRATTPGYLTKQLAQRELDAILADARRASCVAPGGRRRSELRRGRGRVAADVEYDRKRRPSTIRDYRKFVAKVLVPRCARRRSRRSRSAHVDASGPSLVAEALRRGRSTSTSRSIHGILEQGAAGLRSVGERGRRRRAPPDGPLRLTSTSVGPRRSSAHPRRGLAQDARALRDRRVRGMRLGELRALRWRDVDFAKRLGPRPSLVRRRATRACRSRAGCGSVPMIDQVASALDELAAASTSPATRTRVLQRRRQDFRGLGASSALLCGARAAGLKPMRFHDLRHTFGTLAVQVFPLSDVKAYMGHADIATTMIYVHHIPTVTEAERLGAALAAAASSTPTAAEAKRLR